MESAKGYDESEDGGEKEDEAEGEEDNGSGNNFGEEISNIAQELRTGGSTVDQLVDKSTSTHLQVLAEVHKKVPQAAKDTTLKAMKNSVKGNAAAQDALNRKDASNNGSEDEEDEEKEDGPKSRGVHNASEMGKQKRNNNPSNR
ncbi:MAG: hypothetical protein K9H14_06745 [Actinomycetia bacterium]|nr:hypothetical protein [Actinomycetes bacterium]